MRQRMAARSELVALAFALLVSLGLPSCSGRDERVYVPADYATWGKTTDLPLDYPIPGHEDRFRLIYMNDRGFGFESAMETGRPRIEFPVGTIIAKEMYPGPLAEPGQKPVMVTAMIKEPSHPKAKAGWLWVMKDLGSGKETLVEGGFCVNCHDGANEAHPYGDRNPEKAFRDYVFFAPTRGPIRD